MAPPIFSLVSVGLFIIHHASSQNEGFADVEVREWPADNEDASASVGQTPGVFVPPIPDDDVEDRPQTKGLASIPLVNAFFGPPESLVQAPLFDAAAARLRADLEAATKRQEVLAKFVECSRAGECGAAGDSASQEEPGKPLRGYWEWLQSVSSQSTAPGTVTCPPCPGQAGAESAPKGYWEWLQTQNPTPPGAVPCQCPPPKGEGAAARRYRLPAHLEWLLGTGRPAEYVRVDKFYAAMSSFKQSVERLTVRQNMLYEHARCACPAKGECAALAPVLELMFSDNTNVTGEMIRDMVTESRSSLLETLFGWIPGFSGLINFNPLAALSDLFKPTYAGSAGYATSSGDGGAYTVSSGRPGTEHYVVHHPGGGTSHIYTSSGPGATSVSVVSTDQKKETGEDVDTKVPEDSRVDKNEHREPQIEEQKTSPKAGTEAIEEPSADAKSPRERRGTDDSQHTAHDQASVPGVVQTSPDETESADRVRLTPVADSMKFPEDARRFGPGVVHPALANPAPAQYTGFNPAGFGGAQPGIAAAGIGINQGLAAAQYTSG